MPPIWVGFWAPNSLNKGPFFGIFSINKGGLSRTWRKIAKNGRFSAKIHHESGYDRKFRSLEEGTFLKTGRQTPVNPQVMYLLLQQAEPSAPTGGRFGRLGRDSRFICKL